MFRNSVKSSVVSFAVRKGVRTVAALALATTLVSIAGCASGVDGALKPETAVAQMASQRWQALVEGDYAKAYAYAAPSYRKINSLELFRGGKQGAAVKWLAAKVLHVDCEATKCTVAIELESKLMTPIRIKGSLKSGLEETWIQEDGQWWVFEKL